MRTYEYVFRAHCNRLRARLSLNGATVFRTWQPRLQRRQLKLNPWCLVGDNRIEVELARFDEDELPPPTDDEDVPAFWFHLYRVPDDAEPSSLFLMLRYEWHDNEGKLVEGEGARSLFHHRFRIARKFGDWFWLAGDPYTPDDREGVLDALERLQEALVAKDVDRVFAMLAIRRQEICEALDMNLDEVEQDETAYFEEHFAAEDWGLHPWDRQSLVVIPEAGGRLVRVTRADGTMPFVGSGLRPFVFDVTFGRYDGRWVVAR